MTPALALHRPAAMPRPWVPVAVLLFSASLWGLSWWPLKGFAAAGLSGPVLVLLTYGAVGLLGLPFLWRQRRAWQRERGLLLGLALVGGFANAAFVNALVMGDVVRVMLLFYLSPVWSVLGGRFFLGERVTPRRALAVLLALAGAFLVVGGTAAFDAPPQAADLLALVAGLAFAGNNLIARAAQTIPMVSKTVGVFSGCGAMSLLLLATLPGTTVWPNFTLPLGLALAGYGCVWMLLATATWQYGVTHMEAGRSGVILIAELLVALVTATLFGDAHMAPREWIGGAFITVAALLEATAATPTTPRNTTPTETPDPPEPIHEEPAR